MRGGSFLLVVLALVAVAVALLVFDDDGRVAGFEDEQFASLAYVGIWAGVLATGLIALLRTNAGQALRGAAVWALIFAALIGVYAFGSEFRAIGDRMLAVLVPGRAVELAGGDQIMVMRARDEHFHVDAAVNGEPVSFLVDTGASVVALDIPTAERLGIDTANLAFTARMQTANGVAAAAPVFLETVAIGNIVRENVQAVVAEGEGFGISLLGMSFLGTLSSFEFRGDRLVLTD